METQMWTKKSWRRKRYKSQKKKKLKSLSSPFFYFGERAKEEGREGVKQDKYASSWKNNSLSCPFWFMRCFFLDIPSANRQSFDTGALYFTLFSLKTEHCPSMIWKSKGRGQAREERGEGEHWRMSGEHFSRSLKAGREEVVESSWAERVPQVPRRHMPHAATGAGKDTPWINY